MDHTGCCSSRHPDSGSAGVSALEGEWGTSGLTDVHDRRNLQYFVNILFKINLFKAFFFFFHRTPMSVSMGGSGYICLILLSLHTVKCKTSKV